MMMNIPQLTKSLSLTHRVDGVRLARCPSLEVTMLCL